jgi:hypothetical protein
MLETVDMGSFLTLAEHDSGKVLSLSIYPVVDELVYPALYMEQVDMQVLIAKIETLI